MISSYTNCFSKQRKKTHALCPSYELNFGIKPWQNHYKETFLANVDAKVLKIFTLQKYIKNVLYHDQFKFFPEMQVWFKLKN